MVGVSGRGLSVILVAVLWDVCSGQSCPASRPNHCGGVAFTLDQEPLPKDCKAIFDKGKTTSGVYTVFPTDIGYCAPLRVYCDMEDGGGWTVFQRRIDGSEDFYRGWVAYRAGFGNLGGEFWLGNDHLNRLTNQDDYELKIELEDADGERRHAVFSGFKVGDERYHYPLRLGELTSGDAGDSLSMNSGQTFSTRDRQTGQCASAMQGAWWYLYCGDSSLNGLHPLEGDPTHQYGRGIVWGEWHGTGYSLSKTLMKFRPASPEKKKKKTEEVKEEEEVTEVPMVTELPEEEEDVGSGAFALAPDEKQKKTQKSKSGRRARAISKFPWYLH